MTSWQGAARIVRPKLVALFGAWYVTEYRLLNMSKWKGAILAFGIGNPVLYLTSIGLGVGALVSANSPGGVDGVPYLVFLAPALLTNAAIQAAMDETIFPTLHGFVWAKVFRGMQNTPLTGRQIADGVVAAAMLRAVWTAVTYYIIMVIFGAVEIGRGLLSIPAAIFAGWAFGEVLLALAVHVEQDDGFFALINRFILTPMFLFSGTFYPLAVLPVYLQWIGWISPLWHATELGRFLSYGHEMSVPTFIMHVTVLLVTGLIGQRVAYRKYLKRLGE